MVCKKGEICDFSNEPNARKCLIKSSGSMFKSRCSKNVQIFVKKKKVEYTKLTYFEHPKKSIEFHNLRITRIWVQQI